MRGGRDVNGQAASCTVDANNMDHSPKVYVLGSKRANISDRIDPCIASQKKNKGAMAFRAVCVCDEPGSARVEAG